MSHPTCTYGPVSETLTVMVLELECGAVEVLYDARGTDSAFSSFFFFSSRRRHTRLTCDWSSDVCSSDLTRTPGSSSGSGGSPNVRLPRWRRSVAVTRLVSATKTGSSSVSTSSKRTRASRSEERRVGKEWRERWRAEPDKEKQKWTEAHAH